MTTQHDQPLLDTERPRARLIAFGGLLLIAGLGLAEAGGPPRLPSGLPRWGEVLAILAGSTLPVEPLALLLVDLAWLVWAWIVGSLVLELVLVLAEALAHGAAWVRSLRQLADRLSVPLVRHAVAAAFAVQILSRGVSVASAEPLGGVQTTLVQGRYAESEAAQPPPESAAAIGPTYLVRAGDTLWSIAEQAYGSGTQYRRIVEANLGRRMQDGQVFSARGVIRPGWDLLVPDASADLEEADGERWYTVKPGDTLSAVAGQLMGDGSSWDELFELNRGVSTADGRHVLADANVIWPGLRLRVPWPDAPQAEDHSARASREEDDTQTAGPIAADLVAASAPTGAPSIDGGMPPVRLDTTDPLEQPDVGDAPPLVRTPHAVEPVVLEPADTATGGARSSGDISVPASTTRDELPLAPLALGSVGLAVVAGLAFGARRMRGLRPLPQQPESEIVVEGGFAEAQLAQDFTRGLHGVGFDPLAALVGQLDAFLREHNLASAGVVSVRHGRSATTIALKAGLAEQAILVDLAPVFAERLGADAEACVSADQDVVVRLVRLRKTRLLPTADSLRDSPCLVPLGVLYDRQVYSAAWRSLGHVLVASLPGHGADTILTSLVATLTARRSPEQLRVWIVGSSRALPAPVFDLPHLARVVDPANEVALTLAADELRAELDRRAAHRPPADLVVVVPELTSLGEQASRFELQLGRAADLGVRLVAATTCPAEVAESPLVSQFTTRMVLRMQDEEASVALLGVADAAFLGGGGRLLLRLDGREPVELYGYQVATEHLERLVRVMRSAYPSGGAPAALSTNGAASFQAVESAAPLERLPPTDVAPPAEQQATIVAATIIAATEPCRPTATEAPKPTATEAHEPTCTIARGSATRAAAEPPSAQRPSTPANAEHAASPAQRASTPANAEHAASPAQPASAAVNAEQDASAAQPASTRANAEHAASAFQPAATAANAKQAASPARPPATPAKAEHGASPAPIAAARPPIAAARPSIEVVCFGGPRVLCAGQQVWPRLPGGDVKPWELLLYLAAQPAEGVSTRDAVEALWPDDESADDPPHRFRQLRYRLRRMLADISASPETDGICLERGVLKLDPAVVHSDAQEFLSLARTARITPGPEAIEPLERARSLYQGDLLAGPDARRYAWVDERDPSGVTLREHFRRLFQQASVRLAELYTMSGDVDAALDLYRELSEIDPGDERLWRALFRLHAERGDRLALVRDERRMREALRELADEVDDQPGAQFQDASRETVQEYQRLLASLGEREREREPATA